MQMDVAGSQANQNPARSKWMGWLSFWRQRPLSEKRIQKMSKLAANPFAQPEVRMRELERLVQDHTPQAIEGALRRFTANAQGHIADESEKRWLEDALAQLGDIAIEPVRRYIATEQKLTYALRLYRQLVGHTEATAYFLHVLEAYGPEDYRSSEAKLQLLGQLTEHADDPKLAQTLIPFLMDHSDDVQWAVLELFDHMAHDQALLPEIQGQALAVMQSALTIPDRTSLRIAQKMAEFLCQHQWALTEPHNPLLAAVAERYRLDGNKRLQAK